ncbi:MAG: 16S rRNA (adenine(1518)-N(6)/adenine(1519)-N(6))-dimethyltransferase RsmA [Acutalibacteraceae bacterium]|nr:16S rRNA (adenine(1518)-N(6)/adenine(1519)-N(6))-dimethyltransferase RsmA [Acutalibacteraceae bacterium]
MNLADINTLERLLKSEGFSFKKSLGQNFLIDDTVCPAMADAACDPNTGVLEIGPGVGVLTQELAKRAKRVVAIELDERLKKILPKTLGEFNNIKVIFGDAMKLDLEGIIKDEFADCERVCVCANLPYYITSPIIMHLLESRLPIDSVTVMVQKEAGERLCAEVGTRDSGAVTVAVSYFAKAEILFGVDRTSFMPPPNVDSAVIRLKIRDEAPIKLNDEKGFFKFVKACFAQRRKTLVNTVSNSLPVSKDKIRAALTELGLPETVRSEQLTLNQLADLFNILFD